MSIFKQRRATVAALAAGERAPRQTGVLRALLLVAICTAAAASADELAQPPLAIGSRVRVSAPGITAAPVVGTVRALDAQSVTVEVKGQTAPLTLPRDRISKLDLSVGRRSRAMGALIGALVGAGAGALIGKASHTNRPYDFSSADEAGGAIAGLLVGGTVGALIPPGERWREVSGSRYRVSFAPRLERTPGLAFSLSF